MGTCPLCRKTIHTNELTRWRVVEGAPARTHKHCPPGKKTTRVRILQGI